MGHRTRRGTLGCVGWECRPVEFRSRGLRESNPARQHVEWVWETQSSMGRGGGCGLCWLVLRGMSALRSWRGSIVRRRRWQTSDEVYAGRERHTSADDAIEVGPARLCHETYWCNKKEE